MVAWWIMPAATLGIALYARSKRKAGKVRWIPKTEAEVKRLPTGFVMASLLESGDELPAPKEGHRWKELSFLLSTSPLTPPEEVHIHVLDPIFNNAQGLSTFLTSQQMAKEAFELPGGLGSTYLTSQGVKRSPELGFFLTAEYLETAPHLDYFSSEI